MKKAFLIFWLFFPFSGCISFVQGQDTLVYAKEENLFVEPLPYNSYIYNKFKKQRYYNYYHVKIKNEGFLDRLHKKFNQWFLKLMHKTISRKEFNILLWIAGFFLLIIFSIIFYFNKSGIFYFNKKNPLSYSVEEENIAGQNFDYLTEKSIEERRFSDAIRWQYLKILKVLHERDYISYDSHKTVNEYVYEIKDLNLQACFLTLSSEFVYYRYGKGEADMEKFMRFRLAAESIQNMLTG